MGRPPIDPARRKDHTVRVRVTPAQWDKYVRLGKDGWFRRVLEKAKEPGPEKAQDNPTDQPTKRRNKP